jgi:hypothetical protein
MTLEDLKNTIERYCENKDFETAKNYVCTHGPRLGLNLEEELKKIENFGKNPVQQPLQASEVEQAPKEEENEEKKESE